MAKSSVPELTTMLEAGVHFGHDKSKRHPGMDDYVFTHRERVAIIDLEQTHEKLAEATDFLSQVAAQKNAAILYVGTKRQARDVVRRYAEEVNMPYVTKRWLGGTLTNFATIQKSIEKLEELKATLESESAAKLTKKERSVMQKETERLEEVLEGIKTLRSLPAALIVADAHDERLAVREAKRVGVPVVAITDTNADPAQSDYAIPANDDAVRSLDLIIGTLTKAIAAATK